MRKETVGLAVSSAYVWIAMLGFGGIAVETLIIYPNVFHAVPGSLDRSVEFFAVSAPADVFPVLDLATVVIGLAALALNWPVKSARLWTAGSLVSLIIGEWLYSMLFFWPRNEIMFDEGSSVHTVEILQQAASEFETGHWLRLAMSAITATLALAGLLRCHRARVLAGMHATERGARGQRSHS